MSHKVKYNYTSESGSVMSLMDWAATLPEAEKAAFDAANARQNEIFLQLIENNKLSIVDDGQVWNSEADYNTTACDKEFGDFYDRYLMENKITVDVQQTTM